MTTLVEKYILIRMTVVIDPFVWVLQVNKCHEKYRDKAVPDIPLAGIFFECLGANSHRIIVPSLTLNLTLNPVQATKHFLFLSD